MMSVSLADLFFHSRDLAHVARCYSDMGTTEEVKPYFKTPQGLGQLEDWHARSIYDT
jgi:hypothetical protein